MGHRAGRLAVSRRPFPLPSTAGLSDRDLVDLKAFLDSLPAVSRVNAASLSGMFAAARTRGAIIAVAERFPGPSQADPTEGPEWNRGGYLVATSAAAVTVIRRAIGSALRDTARQLAGTSAGPGGKAVPNITPDPETGIGRWSRDDIMALLKDGQTPDFDFVGGAMAEIVKNTTRLTDADRRAIATYLRSLPAIPFRKQG